MAEIDPELAAFFAVLAPDVPYAEAERKWRKFAPNLAELAARRHGTGPRDGSEKTDGALSAPPKAEPLAVSVKRAGEMLDVSARTVYRLIRDGKLRMVPVRGKMRVPVESLREFLGEGSAKRIAAHKQQRSDAG